jgi:peptide/nickel transport system ATP-binding protein
MYLGKMVEFSCTRDLFENPLHQYTEALMSAVPVADPSHARERIKLEGEIPNPADVPTGCCFHTRCGYCKEKCRQEVPELKEQSSGHYVACHYAEKLNLQGFSYQ